MGFAGELAADPVVIPGVDNPFAFDLYHRAQQQDRLMGNHWDEGASVLAGAKACKQAGHISSYRWAFGIDDVIDTLVEVGPVVIGINWYSSMYDTAPGGLVDIGGSLVGGHCILLTGYWPAHPELGDVVVWVNSWGSDYGVHGQAYIRVADLAQLLAQDGDACVLVDVAPTPAPEPFVPPPPPKPPRPQPSTWWQHILYWLGWWP